MRHSIMLQLVSFLTLMLLGTAAFFAWMQNRQTIEQNRTTQESVEAIGA
jgi:CHASE3 domain sensor protein